MKQEAFSKLRLVDVSHNIQYSQRLFNNRISINDETISEVSVSLVVFSKRKQKRNFSLNKPDLTNLANLSN